MARGGVRPSCAPGRQFYAKQNNAQSDLTKPLGSLGQLETLAVQLAAMQGTAQNPRSTSPGITVFAADHGVMQENVSAFPQAVPAKCCAFSQGGAAICVLARPNLAPRSR